MVPDDGHRRDRNDRRPAAVVPAQLGAAVESRDQADGVEYHEFGVESAWKALGVRRRGRQRRRVGCRGRERGFASAGVSRRARGGRRTELDGASRRSRGRRRGRRHRDEPPAVFEAVGRGTGAHAVARVQRVHRHGLVDAYALCDAGVARESRGPERVGEASGEAGVGGGGRRGGVVAEPVVRRECAGGRRGVR